MTRSSPNRLDATSKFRKGAVGTAHTAFKNLSQLRNEPHEGEKVKDKNKRSILRRGLLAGAMTLAGFGATVAVAAAPAGASSTEMTAVGSFTTFFMMHALFPEVNMINPIPESGTLSQSIAADAPNATFASLVNPLVITTLVSFCGVFAPYSQITAFWRYW